MATRHPTSFLRRMTRPLLPVLLAAAADAHAGSADRPTFHDWAPTPPMGWNSWDCFATTVTEEQTKAQADFMAAKLKAHGWQYIVVDIQWYEPGAKSHAYRADATLVMDEHGRLLPAPNRFPSSTAGRGFKPLADYVHGLGLKFGVHLMRGIPRQAVEKNLPILGTKYRAQDIADRDNICPWNPDMYGVDVTKPGAQEYYDSVFALLASWGVDYVKVDDISRPYLKHQDEIEAVRKAIDRTGHPIVLSLSPGETVLEAADHVTRHANLWRISDDFWDRWLALHDQFGRLAAWNPHRRPGAWPDADMLPLGTLVLGERTTRFTPDEQRTLMTLWSIARSPLMHGGDMTKTDDFTLSLLTNDEVLAVNQRSENNRPLFSNDDFIAWTADVPGSPDKYLAMFNARDRVPLTPENARYASGPVTGDPSTAATLDVDVAGGSQLFLVARPLHVSGEWNRVLWRDARLAFADGSEKPLAEFTWTHADACWDSTAVKKDESGKVLGIGAEIPAVVSYALPAGAVRLRASAEVLSNGRGQTPGPVQFLVVVGTPGNTGADAGMPVPVTLADLGFAAGARIRDLWTHTDLGTATGTFAPVIPFHGAGLYRLSPAPRH
ncbi:MAG: glycoside hydrolase family 27 protein [Opitutaceae bacterium]|nr:glycoside hydrolase family 27 protein [Opitutaceae bacterium]